jgi:hypothetical protein
MSCSTRSQQVAQAFLPAVSPTFLSAGGSISDVFTCSARLAVKTRETVEWIACAAREDVPGLIPLYYL